MLSLNLLASLCLLSCLDMSRLQATDVDLAFDADVRKFGSGRAVALQADGKVVVAGYFSRVHGQPGSTVARFESGGALDPTFLAGSAFNGGASAVAVQSDGRILIGGNFTAHTVDGVVTPRNGIARLNADGTLDTSFNPGTGTGVDGSVLAIALQSDGKAIIAGSFTTFNGTARNRIARLNTDGSLDTTFNPGAGANGTVWDLALQPDGKVVLTGSFSQVAGVARTGIARLNANGSLDTAVAFSAAPNGSVYAVAIDASGRFMIGGNFTSVGGTTRYRLARLSTAGALDADFHPGGGLNGLVADLRFDSAGRLLVAGGFDGYANAFVSGPPGLVRIVDGANDDSFAVSPLEVAHSRSAYVSGIAITPGDGVLAAGFLFDVASGQAGLVRVDSTGAAVTSFNSHRGLEASASIRAMANGSRGNYYLAGDFDWIAGGPRVNLARFTPNARLDPTFVPGSDYMIENYDGPISAVVERADGQVWAFGSFTSVADSGGFSTYDRAGAARFAANGELQFDTADPLSFTGGVVNHAAADSQGRLVVAGTFTAVNGTARAGLARVSAAGVLDATFASGSGVADGVITDLAVDASDRVLVAGSFTNFSGAGEAYLVRLDAATGTVDGAFAGNTAFNGLLNSVEALADGRIVVGGNFTTSGGFQARGIDRLLADGTSDPDFLPGDGADNYVYAARPDAQGRILVAGAFQNLRGAARPAGLGRMTADGPLDTLFDDTSLQGGYAFDLLERPDGKLLVRGSFTGVDGEAREAVARFHAVPVRRGAPESVQAGAGLFNNTVRGVVPLPDGGIIAVGEFTNASGVARNRIARLDAFGAVDPTFAYTDGFNGTAQGAAYCADGDIIVWGNFSAYNGAAVSGLVKLNPDGTRDATFVSAVFNSAINVAVPLADGRVLVGGVFTSAGANPRGGLARLLPSGAVDSTFVVPVGTDGAVNAITVDSTGHVWAGGDFTTFAGVAAPRIVRLDATGARAAGFGAGEGASHAVHALAPAADGGVYVGGAFQTFAGAARRGLVQLDATGGLVEAFLSGFGADGEVRTLLPLADGRLYVAGTFTALGGGEHRGLARLTAAGLIDPVFDAGTGFNGAIHALGLLGDGRLAAGGAFTRYAGVERNRFAVLYAGDAGAPVVPADEEIVHEIDAGADLEFGYGAIEGLRYQWYRDGVRLAGATAPTYAIENASLDDLGLYTLVLSNGGGEFTTRGFRVIVRLAPVISAAPVAASVGYGASASFSAGAVGPGPFTYQWFRDGETVDGATDSTFTVANVGDADFGTMIFVRITNAYGSVDSTPVALGFDPAAVPGAIVLPFAGRFESPISSPTAMARSTDGKIYLAGSSQLVRLNADGSLDDGFAPGISVISSPVVAVQSDGRLVVAGRVSTPAGGQKLVVRLLPSGAVDPSFTPPAYSSFSTINTLAIQSDGKIVIGGSFSQVDGTVRQNLARLNADGTLDGSFAPVDDATGPNGAVHAVRIDGARLIVAGEFTAYRGTTVGRLVRINANNTVDTTFLSTVGANAAVEDVVADGAGRWLIRGTFNSYAGVARPRLARLSANGALDATFDPGSGPAGSSRFDTPYLNGLAPGGNGTVVVTGYFRSFGGWPAVNSVRLTATGAVDTQWATPAEAGFTRLLSDGTGPLWAVGSYRFPGESSNRAFFEVLGGSFPPQPPTIHEHPTASTLAFLPGARVSLESLVSGPGALALQWYRNGTPVVDSDTVDGAQTARLTLRSVRAAEAGDYVLRVTSAEHGFRESAAATVLVEPEQSGRGALDLTWAADPQSGQTLAVVPAPDGGAFGVYRDYPTNWVGKWDANGRVVPAATFNPGLGFNDTVLGVAPQGDGKVLVWGQFTTAQGVARNGLARLNADGSLDSGYNPASETGITGIELQSDNRAIVFGYFAAIGGQSRAGIARLATSGAVESFAATGHGFRSVSRVAIAPNGSVYVLGQNASTFQQELIRLTSAGAVDGGFARVPVTGTVNSIVVDAANRPLLGGSFSSVGGQSRYGLVRLTTAGAVDDTYGPTASSGPGGEVQTLRFGGDGWLYVLGSFSAWDGFALGPLVRLDERGQLDLTFPAAGVRRISSASSGSLGWAGSDRLVLMGSFSYSPRAQWIRLHAEVPPSAGAPVLEDSSGDRLVSEGVELPLYARFTGGAPLSYTWTRNGVPIAGAIGPQLALAAPTPADAGTYVVTATNAHGSASATMEVAFIAADPLGPVASFNLANGISGDFSVVVPRSGGGWLVGGTFYNIDGAPRPGFAAFTAGGDIDTTFNAALPFTSTGSLWVYAVAVESDGRILVGGRLTMADGSTKHLVRLNANGSLAQVLLDDTQANSDVRAILTQSNGDIIVGGTFTSILGGTQRYLARLTSTGALDSGFAAPQFPGAVHGLAERPGGGFLARGSVSLEGASRYVFGIDATGAIDPDYAPPLSNSPNGFMVAPDGAVFAWGLNVLARVGGEDQRLLKLRPDGTIDPGFRSPFTSVDVAGFDPLGRLVAVGRLPGAQGHQSTLARLLPTGDVDRSVALTSSAAVLRPVGERLLVAGPGVGAINSRSVRQFAFVNPGALEPLQLISPPVATAAVAGGAVTLRAGVRGGEEAVYQWFHDGDAIAGADGPTLTLDPVEAANLGDYHVTVTRGEDSVSSDPVAVTALINPARAGQVDLAWGPSLNVTGVQGIGTDSTGRLVAFGPVSVNGAAAKAAVAFDATGRVDESFVVDSRVQVYSGSIRGQVEPGGRVWLFGISSYLRFDGSTRSAIPLTASGTLDPSINSTTFTQGNPYGVVTLANGKLLFYGSGLPGQSVAVYDTEGNRDTAISGLNGTIYAVYPASNDKWWAVGSAYSSELGASLAVWRLNADGSLDATYRGLPLRYSESLSRYAPGPDGSFYIALRWSPASAVTYRLLRIGADGRPDPGFVAGPFTDSDGVTIREITDMATDSQGRLVVVGNFSAHDGVPRGGVVRLLSDGSADLSLDSPGAGGTMSYPSLVATGADDRIYLAGSQLVNFGGYGDRSGLVALQAMAPAVDALPVATGTLGPRALGAYETLSLQAPVYGPAAATYQWSRNGQPLSGQTGRRLRIVGATSAETGDYTLTLTTSGGTFTTAPVAVAVPTASFSGALSDRNRAAEIEGWVRKLVRRPDGGVLVVSNGSYVDGHGPFELYTLNADGSFREGYPALFSLGNSSPSIEAAAVDSLGNIYVGGSFTKVDGLTRNRIVRLTPQGEVDATWDPGVGFNNTVRALAVDAQDRLLVGGSFSQFQGVNARFVARLATDGTLDTSFNIGTGPNNYVDHIVVQSGDRVVIGGVFNQFNSVTSGRLLRLDADGTRDGTFDPVPNNTVRGLVGLSDDRLLVGGDFSNIGGVARNRFAWLTASGAVSDINPTFPFGNVFPIAALETGDAFAASSGSLGRNLPDGSVDTQFQQANAWRGYFMQAHSTTRINPSAMLGVDGQLLVGGIFERVGTARRVGLAWLAPALVEGPVIGTPPANLSLPEGGLASWSVTATTSSGTLTYTWTRVGGNGAVLSTTSSLALSNVTPADAGTYRVVVSNGLSSTEANVQLLVTPAPASGPGTADLRFYGAGLGNSVRGAALAAEGRLWVLNTSYFERLLPDGSRDLTFTPISLTGGSAEGMTLGTDGHLYVWGSFTGIGELASPYLARLTPQGTVDPTFVSPFIDRPNIRDLEVDSGTGRIYLAWDNADLLIGGVPTRGIGRLLANGTPDAAFATTGGATGSVQAIELLDDGRVLIAGSFTAVGTAARRGVARLLASGAVDPSFNAIDVSNVVQLLRLPDGRLLIGGNFNTVDGLGRPRLARLTADGNVDPSFAFTGATISSVQRLALRPDGRILLAAFFSENNVNRSRVLQLLPDGAIDSVFGPTQTFTSSTNAGHPGTVYQLLGLPDGDLYVAGGIAYLDATVQRPGLVKLFGSPLGPKLLGSTLRHVEATAGGAVSFSVTASGAGTLAYQWRRDGNPIEGATGATLDLTALTAADGGDYDVVISNAYATVISETATLSIPAEPQSITFAPLADRAFDPAPVTLTATASSGLTVSFEIVEGAATLEGDALTLTGVGLVTVRASQAGGFGFEAALPVERSFTVTPAPVSVTLGDLTATYDGEPHAVSVTTSVADLPVVVTYDDSVSVPSSAGSYAVVATIDDARYAGSVSGTLVIAPAAGAVDWTDPAAIVFGTALGVTELDATADVPGSFTYDPAAGTVLDAGTHTLTVTFAPSDSANYLPAAAEVTLVVTPAPVGVTLSNLVRTYNGQPQAVSATTAVIGLPVIVTYAGESVAPIDAGNYAVQAVINHPNYAGSASGTLTIGQATPVLTWQTPAAIVYGTALDSSQLNADAGLPGTYGYEPAAGVVLATGEHELTVTFTPADSTNYTTVTRTQTLEVDRATPVITWIPEGPLVDGDALDDRVLNAQTAVAGTFTYTPAAGTVLAPGEHTVTASFQPDDTTNYTTVETQRTITVAPAAPVITVQPQSQVVLTGTDVTLSVVATGSDPLTYQWRKDGVPIANATGATLTLPAVTEDDGADYDVVVTDPHGTATSAVAALVVAEVTATHALRGAGYVTGGTITIDVTIAYSPGVTNLRMPILMPEAVNGEAWSYESASTPVFPGGAASAPPFADWGFTGLPPSPFSFNYTFRVPAGASGDYELVSWLEIYVAGTTLDDMVTPDPLVLHALPATHSADTNADYQLSLTELLRVIELYNTRKGTTRTGRYRPAVGTEDGFTSDSATSAGVAPDFTAYHSADSNRNGELSLTELLRVIELYNTRAGTTRTGRYHVSPGTEDGFASGPGT